MLDQRYPENWAEIIRQYRVPVSVFYTPILPIFTGTDSFSKVDLSFQKMIFAAGSALSAEMRRQILTQYSIYHSIKPIIGQMYGSTELGIASFRTPFSSDPNIAMNSVGVQPRTRDFKIEVSF